LEWRSREGEVLGVVPLLRAEDSEKESQVGLPEDVRSTEAETMILPRTPMRPSLSTLPEALTVAA